MSTTRQLKVRARKLLAQLNEWRANEPREEYDRCFPARWELIRNVVERIRLSERAFVGLSWEDRCHGEITDGVFSLSEARDVAPGRRTVHPMRFHHRSVVPASLMTKRGWRRAGRVLRYDAKWAHMVARSGHDFGGPDRELFLTEDTCVLPTTLLPFPWPEGAAGFLKRLNDQPDDTTAWLVLADWCQENDLDERVLDIRRYWEWRALGIVD